MRGPRSLAGRVTLAAAAAVGGALVVGGAAVVIAAGRADRAALDRDLRQSADRATRPGGRLADRDEGPGAPGAPPPPPGLEERGAPGPIDPGADRFVRIVFRDRESLEAGATVPANFPVPAGPEPQTVQAGGEKWRTVVRRLPRGARLQVAARLQPLEDRARRLLLVVLAALLGALAATALATRGLVRLALRPLEGLRGTAGRVAATADLAERVPRGGPEEVDALAADLNAMLARLEQTAAGREAALSSARRFAADAGHELRTPLTSLRANLAALEHEGALDDRARAALVACEADGERLAGLVEQLQALARGEAGPPRAAQDVDLGDLADAALAGLRARHPEVSSTLAAPEVAPVLRGDPEGLRQLADNLLENAARHGKPGGTIAVTVAPLEDGEAELMVDDDGPGLPEAERGKVLARFARGSGARGSGSGLGLAIAAAQAVRHGGELTLGESPLGGLRARAALRGVDAAPASAG